MAIAAAHHGLFMKGGKKNGKKNLRAQQKEDHVS